MKNLQSTEQIKWQAKLDLLSELTNATATAIMRRTDNDGLKASFVSYSDNYPQLADGPKDQLEAFCETVFQHQDKLQKYANSGVIPFQIFPINYPDKTPFGALCILGFKAEYNTPSYRRLIERCKNTIEKDLQLQSKGNSDSSPEEHIQENKLNMKPALGKSDEKFTRLFENSRDTIFILDRDLIFTACNSMALNMLERPESDIIGRSPAFISPTHQANGVLSSEMILKDTTLAFQGVDHCFVWVLLKKDGTEVPVEVSLFGFTENNQKYLYALVKNFSEIKRKEQELEDSEERFRTIYAQSADGIVLHEPNNGYTECNQAALQILGMKSKDELVGRSILDFSPEIQPNGYRSSRLARVHLHHCMVRGQTRFEWVHLKKDGSPIWLDIVLTKIHYNNKEFVHALWRDIDQVKQFQEELLQHQNHLQELVNNKSKELIGAYEESQELNEKLQIANTGLQNTNKKLKDQKKELKKLLRDLHNAKEQLIDSEKMVTLGTLTSGVAHEINNPLNFISGGSQLIESTLKENFPKSIPLVDLFFDSINKGVERIAEIVQFLGKYRRDYNYEKIPCDIHEVVDDCLTILKGQCEEKSVEIIRDYIKEPITLQANVGEMHHAILNILLNAIDAVNGDGHVKISSDRKKDLVKLVISDNGYGIKQDDLKLIFDPFFTTKDPGMGTGIGLSMSKKIIKDHHGSIKCISKVNEGSSFIIHLPLV